MTEYDKNYIINMVKTEARDAKMAYFKAIESKNIDSVIVQAREKMAKCFIRDLVIKSLKNT